MLREAHLRKIGLDVNKPVDVNTLKNISDRDMDLGRILFPGQNATSLSAKMYKIENFNNLLRIRIILYQVLNQVYCKE